MDMEAFRFPNEFPPKKKSSQGPLKYGQYARKKIAMAKRGERW